MKITPAVFEAYLKCPTKCWLRATGEAASGNTYAEWVQAQNASYRETGTARLIAASPHDEVALSPDMESVKTATWRLASSLAVQAEMDPCALESELHAVERVPSGGRGKAAQFIPIRFVFTNKLGKDDKLLLALDAVALSKALKREVSLGKIIHGDNHATLKVKTSALAGEVRKRLEQITSLFARATPPDLVLNRHCAECEFQTRCRKIAVEKDDLSLLGGMSEMERNRHRSKGIFTVTQLSYTFRPRRTPKRAKNPAKPRYLALQALAIRENTVYIHGTPILPQSKTQVYLDIEGLPDRDFHYLIGTLVVSDGQETFHSFWADTQADEAIIFAQFADTISQLENFRVFHFGDYDTAALKRMKPHLSESHQKLLDLILGQCTNVLSALYPHVYFPTYSNSLKDIGGLVAADCSTREATGLHSMIWRTEWEAQHELDLKAKLIEYNRTDCLALKKLKEFILSNTASATSSEETGAKVKYTDDIQKARPRWRMFAPKDYALEDLRHINKCGYFDYQREKVFVKTHKHFREIGDRGHKRKCRSLRPNKIVDLVRKQCPACKSKNLQPTTFRGRYSLNLKFTRSGVKRAVTCIRCWTYICAGCGGNVTARPQFSTQQIYEHDLMSWFVYFNVISGLNMLKARKCLEDILGLRVDNGQIYRFKQYISAGYSSLDNELLGAIVKSPVIHIDETTVNLRDQTGYVWVVTTMDMVHFFYRPTREASFLTEMFGAFSGILISDFFTGYDSVPCPQQKCLVHLVRELDDDLVHNPFNDQFKVLAQGFGSLLRPIIETIERYGLKRRHLAKHKREVDRFLRTMEGLKPDSELVEKYRNRFVKYWPKMFTFLDFDGVPWNNNNAEHAIKRFAKYRRNADGCYTERSLKEYLVLASVLETCEFNKVNVLKFLLSKETTLEGLLRMAGRERHARTSHTPSVPTQADPESGDQH
jgi:predicted RecB family nuclease